MADDVTATELATQPEPLPAPEQAFAAPSRRERARTTAYRARFAVVYVILAAVVGAAVGTFIVLVMRPDSPAARPWSDWQPQGREIAYPQEIADHVGAQYRLPSGNQLVGVLASPAVIQDLPIRAVLIQHRSSTPGNRGEVEVIETGDSVMFNLCGSGDKCSIPEGAPSAERAQLLRREALELALYTFKYVGDADSVIAFLPTNLGDLNDENDDTATTLFLQRKELDHELSVPLRETLASERTMVAGVELGANDALVVDRLTKRRHYIFRIEQTQDLSAILRLQPVEG